MAKHRGASVLVIALALALTTTLAACGGGDDGDGEGADGSTATTTPAADDEASLYVLMTDANGIATPGLAALVQSVYQQPDLAVGVVAPDPTTLAPAPLVDGEPVATTFTPTAGGFPGVVVPVGSEDAVRAAIAGRVDGLPADQGTPELVIAGANPGQLIGSLAEFSANVPAARAAAAAGVPALVVAQGMDAGTPDYANAAAQTVAWLDEHHDALEAGDVPAGVTILSVPSCTTGEPRGVVEVPIAADDAGRPLNVVDCASVATDPADDVEAFTTGWATLTQLPAADAATETTAPVDTTAAGG